MQRVQKLTPCLWFDDQAEEAAKFYCAIFDHSKITGITHYGKAGQEIHGRPEGSVMTVSFELDGQSFTGLNGGPVFKFNEAISFQVNCHTQEEVDHFWGTPVCGRPRRGPAMRLAQGQIRRVVADRAGGADAHDERPRHDKIPARHASDVADEKTRHRRTATSLCRRELIHSGAGLPRTLR